VPLLVAALDGRLGGAIQGALEGHRAVDPAHRDLEYYARNARIILGRSVIACALLALLGVALARRRRLADATRRFFAAEGLGGRPGDPADRHLLPVRVRGGAVQHALLQRAAGGAAHAAGRPRMAPADAPVDPQVGWAALLLFRVACVATVLGCFTRVSAVLTVLAGAWSLAIPQLYGKLNHDHHVMWFAALLAVSPCADVLAIDAVRAARRRADRGAVDPPGPARAYALPIRVIWVLLGIVYFFPGFWKIWTTGFTWISADNLRNQMFSSGGSSTAGRR
jgi:hypothetical protein